IEQLKLAVNAVEAVSARLNSELTRSTFVEDKVVLYDELVRLMGTSHVEESFQYAERRRAQAFIESLRRQGVPLASPNDSQLLHKKAELETILIGKQKALWEELSRPTPQRSEDRITAISRQLGDVRAQHTELLRRIEEAEPAEGARHGIVTA